MNRRTFSQTVAQILTSSALMEGVTTGADAAPQKGGVYQMPMPTGPPLEIGMLLYPDFVALDLIGPHTFLAGLMNVRVHLLWKNKELIESDRGIAIKPTASLSECPANLDVLFVPGGLKGTTAMMDDSEVIGFLKDRGKRARYVTSVCTGSLVLGAAGLLDGYNATSHWTVRELLPMFGAKVRKERVVADRNRFTGGGVTAGIDFGLRMAAEIRDPAYAKMLQLAFEYDPQPPFHAGSPEAAGPELTQHLVMMRGPSVEEARQAAKRAQQRLKA